MTVTVNGTAQELHRARTIAGLVEELALPAPAILIEHNGLALHRSEWDTRPVADGDRLEVLRVVAGG